MQLRNQSTLQETVPPDGMLLNQSRSGDEFAFEALLNRYRNPLLRHIQHILNDDEQAYDVLQFVLLQLYTSQTTLLADIPLHGWLFQVAYHRSLDELRKRRRKPSIYFSELSSGKEYTHEAILL